MESKGPDRVYIRKADRSVYDQLNNKMKSSPFYKKKNRVLYMAALVIGFTDAERLELTSKEGYILLESLEDVDKAIIKAIAVAEEGDLNALVDKEKVYTIADEYAAGGIQLLKDEILGGGYGSYIKKLESRLVEESKKIKKGSM